MRRCSAPDAAGALGARSRAPPDRPGAAALRRRLPGRCRGSAGRPAARAARRRAAAGCARRRFGDRARAPVSTARLRRAPGARACSADAVAAADRTRDADGELEADGFRFRLPDSRDLAALLGQRTRMSAAADLLERCCVERPDRRRAAVSPRSARRRRSRARGARPERRPRAGPRLRGLRARVDRALRRRGRRLGRARRPGPRAARRRCTRWRAPTAGASARSSRSASSGARPIWSMVTA